MQTHVHYGKTLCCWHFGIKGGVVEVLEKRKRERKGVKSWAAALSAQAQGHWAGPSLSSTSRTRMQRVRLGNKRVRWLPWRIHLKESRGSSFMATRVRRWSGISPGGVASQRVVVSDRGSGTGVGSRWQTRGGVNSPF
jgi:hypothetical protein